MTADTRRPILGREQAHLERLGRMLRTTRRALGMTQEQVALGAGMHRVHLDRLESGKRRTRRSTLTRIAAVFVVQEPRLGPVGRLVADLVAEVGPALAEESAYAERVARRRALRTDRAYDQFEANERRALWFFLRQCEQDGRWRPPGQLEEVETGLLGLFAERLRDARQERAEIDRQAS